MESVFEAVGQLQSVRVAEDAREAALDRLCGLWIADGLSDPIYRVQKGGAGWLWVRAEGSIRNDLRGTAIMADVYRAGGAAMVGLWVADSDGKTVYVCPKWSEISGVSTEEAMGKWWLRGLRLIDAEGAVRQWRQALLEQHAFIKGIRFVHGDGRVVRALCQAVPVADERGKLQEWVGTLLELRGSELSGGQVAACRDREQSAPWRGFHGTEKQ